MAQPNLLPPASQIALLPSASRERLSVAFLCDSAQDRFYQLPPVTEFPKAITRAPRCLQGVELRERELGYPAGNGGSGVCGQHKERQRRPIQRPDSVQACSNKESSDWWGGRHSRYRAQQAKAQCGFGGLSLPVSSLVCPGMEKQPL